MQTAEKQCKQLGMGTLSVKSRRGHQIAVLLGTWVSSLTAKPLFRVSSLQVHAHSCGKPNNKAAILGIYLQTMHINIGDGLSMEPH